MQLLLSLFVSTSLCTSSPFLSSLSTFSQEFNDDKNILKYVANRGPYSDRRGCGLNRDPPSNCKVDQVVMLARHGERYPTESAFKLELKTINKVMNISKHSGSLSFVDNWSFYAHPQSGWIEQETSMGPYSGLLNAYSHGALYRNRYGHLYDEQTRLPLFISAFQRDADTGRKFGQGFLSWNYTDMAAVNFISERNGSNSLSVDCKAQNQNSKQKEKEKETHLTHLNKKTTCPPFGLPAEFTATVNRLNNENQGMHLNESDILQLMDIAAFELNIRGSSPWIDVFTADEWVAYEYYVTSMYYCTVGPGSHDGKVMGSVYLKGVRDLLMNGPKKSKLPLTFSFAHETDILKVAAAIGVDEPDDPKTWDPTQTQFNQRYTLTDLVPQGARLVFERLHCNPNMTSSEYSNHHGDDDAHDDKDDEDNIYIRLVINEAVVPLRNCSSGPGGSCKLSDFNKWVDNRTKGMDFAKQCTLKTEPQTFDVFTNFHTETTFNADDTHVPFRARLLNFTEVSKDRQQ